VGQPLIYCRSKVSSGRVRAHLYWGVTNSLCDQFDWCTGPHYRGHPGACLGVLKGSFLHVYGGLIATKRNGLDKDIENLTRKMEGCISSHVGAREEIVNKANTKIIDFGKDPEKVLINVNDEPVESKECIKALEFQVDFYLIYVLPH